MESPSGRWETRKGKGGVTDKGNLEALGHQVGRVEMTHVDP